MENALGFVLLLAIFIGLAFLATRLLKRMQDRGEHNRGESSSSIPPTDGSV